MEDDEGREKKKTGLPVPSRFEENLQDRAKAAGGERRRRAREGAKLKKEQKRKMKGTLLGVQEGRKKSLQLLIGNVSLHVFQSAVTIPTVHTFVRKEEDRGSKKDKTSQKRKVPTVHRHGSLSQQR